MSITVRPEVLVAHLDGESVLLDLDSKNYFRLNVTASTVWKGLEAGKGKPELIKELQEQFAVEPATAAVGVDAIIEQLAERNLVVVVPE